MSIRVGSLLLLAGASCGGAEQGEVAALEVSLTSSRATFIYGAFVIWRLTITNMSAKPIVLPAFRLADTNAGRKTPSVVNGRILKVHLRQGSRTVPAKDPWWDRPGFVQGGPPRELQPGGVMHAEYLPWEFVDRLQVGEYSLSISLDTAACADPTITKGTWVAPPTTFRILPRLTFRSRQAGESMEDYAWARVGFFLKESTPERDGWPLYLNEITSTQGAVPALIELSYSSDKDAASRASALLRRIRLGRSGPLPGSKQAWLEWWSETGFGLKEWQLWQDAAVQ